MHRFETRIENIGYIIPPQGRKWWERGGGEDIVLRAEELLGRQAWATLETEGFGPLWVKPNGHGKLTIDSTEPRPSLLAAYLIAGERAALPLRVYARRGKWEFYRSFTT
ncbi:MAG: hypothetical protein HYX86_06215 [Chloroflexi bacterium]|nr:hypothetical protein [Chloroflexota bacterium]